jgi:hypothetical protein
MYAGMGAIKKAKDLVFTRPHPNPPPVWGGKKWLISALAEHSCFIRIFILKTLVGAPEQSVRPDV